MARLQSAGIPEARPAGGCGVPRRAWPERAVPLERSPARDADLTLPDRRPRGTAGGSRGVAVALTAAVRSRRTPRSEDGSPGNLES